MSTCLSPEEVASDAAVARAMRNLEPDISAIVNMSLIASLGLDEMLDIENAEALGPEAYRFAISRMLIEKQEWAATHVWELAKQLRERFEAAYRGLILI